MEKKICYCFGYTESQIENDVRLHGYSTILEELVKEKTLGLCLCAIKKRRGIDVLEKFVSW